MASRGLGWIGMRLPIAEAAATPPEMEIPPLQFDGQALSSTPTLRAPGIRLRSLWPSRQNSGQYRRQRAPPLLCDSLQVSRVLCPFLPEQIRQRLPRPAGWTIASGVGSSPQNFVNVQTNIAVIRSCSPWQIPEAALPPQPHPHAIAPGCGQLP